MNLPRILYSMCYDMLEQNHDAFKTKNGLAVACPETPLWIWLAHKNDARLFFDQFLQQNETPLLGIVAEKEIALTCAEIYACQQNRPLDTFSQKELVSYFLPQEKILPNKTARGELKICTPQEMPLILEWIKNFYKETLRSEIPQTLKFFGEGGSGGEPFVHKRFSPRGLIFSAPLRHNPRRQRKIPS